MINTCCWLLWVLAILVAGTPSCQQRMAIPAKDSWSYWAEVRRVAKRLVKASDLIVVGSVTAVYDGTHRDAGMSYDVEIENAIHGKHSGTTLNFASPGWLGYAKYAKGEKVLLFLALSGTTSPRLQHVVMDGHRVICYIHGDMVKGPLGYRPVEEYVKIVREAR